MRLTQKIGSTYYNNILNKEQLALAERKDETIRITNAIYDKLGQLEDIEDELGIDLITLFKALQNGIWIKQKGQIKNLLFFYEDVNLYKDYLYACPADIYEERVSTHQYGETWALDKEELENDK